MQDIGPVLLKRIQEDFQKNYDKSEVIAKLYAKVRDGTATYDEANDYAIEVGELLVNAYKNNLSSNVLPDGKMYYNIANSTVDPTMKNNYNLVSEFTGQVQTKLNQAAGIGIKAVKPELNKDRIRGIIDKLSNTEKFDDVAWVLDGPILNFTQSIVDDAIKANAKFQYDAGMNPKIIRTSTGRCCEWCSKLVGIYNYEEVSDTGNAVFRRHQHCRCKVLYDPKDGRGKVQNTHSKKWKNIKKDAKIALRKGIGVGTTFRQRTANMTPKEYARAVELWRQVEEVPYMSQSEKEYVYEEFDNNLTLEEKENAIVSRPIGNYWYYAINKGHNQYKIYEKRPIEPAKDIVDEVLTEMFGANWKEMLGE